MNQTSRLEPPQIEYQALMQNIYIYHNSTATIQESNIDEHEGGLTPQAKTSRKAKIPVIEEYVVCKKTEKNATPPIECPKT